MQPSLIDVKEGVSLAQHVNARLSFTAICQKMSLSQMPGVPGDKYTFWECPFHECPMSAESSLLSNKISGAGWSRIAAKHPMRISKDQLFECAACGRTGDVLDFYAEIKGFANSTLAAVYLLNNQTDIPKNWKLTSHGGTYRGASESESGWLYLKPPVSEQMDWNMVQCGMESLYNCEVDSPSIRSLISYAKQKRWMAPDEIEAAPYPVGLGPTMNVGEGMQSFSTLQFPKLILTEQSSKFYELDCNSLVGVKYRLSPDGERVLSENRRKVVSPWTFSSEYPQSMAWEFDSNQDAPCLFVTIGPTSGVALYHEAWRNQETINRYGSKWHIMGFDSFFNLSSLSLVRRVVNGETVSLFDRYRYIWLVFGDQNYGVREEQLARLGASIIKGQNSEAAVSLLKLNAPSIDLFFEEGGRLSDFALLAKISETV